MIEHISSTRGYDRGYTSATKHAHDLIDDYINWLEEYRCVMEDEGDQTEHVATIQSNINVLQHAKLIIRKGRWDCDDDHVTA